MQCRYFFATRPIPACNKKHRNCLAGIPRACSFRLTSRNRPPTCLASLATRPIPACNKKHKNSVLAGIPRACSFRFTSKNHPPACPAVLATRQIPACNKKHKDCFGGDPRASLFRVTSKKHPPACSMVLATPSPATIDVAASRWLCCRCVVSFLQRNKPKLSGTYLQLLGLHSTKCLAFSPPSLT